ncbi:acylneuraminate cytidylyltransferase family protein [uncultured Phocaeicola sp.]|uniref:acylneuraminate cytidylyltransferase family protein n=1 Tax=uncultured Phocaeicola sp. TaxID=990718 RepID=UPI0025CCEDFE|nr:acylneuraminate cytidylyltransferase family protein [uncultured Phocaeicola sp.]
MMKNIAFVPVRKDSKGIIRKNTKPLCGKPLLFWILDTLVQSSFFNEVWLATDCNKTEKATIGRYGEKIKIYRRSDSSATDNASVMEVIKEFILWGKFDASDWISLFQATSPFTTIHNIKKMLDLIKSGKYDSIVSCTRLKKFRWSDTGIPLDYSLMNKPRRQDYKGFWVESGNFYSTSIQIILSKPYILSGKVGIVEIDSTLAIDIDEPCDWVVAEYIATNLISKL